MHYLKRTNIFIIAMLALICCLPGVSLSQNSNANTGFGCQNTDSARCVDLGSQNENASGVKFYGLEKNSSDTWVPVEKGISDLFNAPSAEDGFNFRTFKDRETLEEFRVSFDSLGETDANGFPVDDYLLEIHYQDLYKGNGAGMKNPERVFIESVMNYGGFTNLEIGKLLGANIGDWKYEQIYFPKTDWQRLRAINGKYSFLIKDLRKDANKVRIPIDYISFKKVTPEESVRIRELQASNFGSSELNYVENNTAPSFLGDYTWFSVPTMKPIYPNQVPLQSEVKKSIQVSSAYSQIEPFNFGIYAKTQLDGISFQANDLELETDVATKLPAEKITIGKVVYGYKFWSSRGGKYGLQPDYVEQISSSVSIKANTSQQFWGEITVDASLKPGKYHGAIDVVRGGQKEQSIPITVEVAPVTLSEPTFINALYSDPTYNQIISGIPYAKIYGSTDRIKEDYKENGINNVISDLDVTIAQNCGSVDYTAFKNNFMTLKDEGLISDVAVYRMVPAWSRIAKSCSQSGPFWVTRRDANYKAKLEEVFKEIKNFAESQKTEIILIGEDEPGKNPDRRMQVLVSSSVAHKVGLRVWSTYSEDATRLQRCTIDSGKTFCAPCNGGDDFCYKLDPNSNESYIDTLTDAVDFKVWALGSISKKESDFRDAFGYYTTNYLQIRNPVVNRFLNSYYAYNAEGVGAKMVANWAYIGEAGSDPYNDFDQNPRYDANRFRQDYLLSYPSWDGKPKPTFAMKGLKEGLKDARYIATLKELIAADPNNPDSIAADNFLKNYADSKVKKYFTRNYASGDYGIHNKIVASLSGGDQNDYGVFDLNRNEMIKYIQKLNKPHVTIRANKTKVYSGDEIMYTVEMKNSTASNLNNLNMSAPVPSGTTYIEGSASDNGSYQGGKVSWNISNLNGNQNVKMIFKVKVK